MTTELAQKELIILGAGARAAIEATLKEQVQEVPRGEYFDELKEQLQTVSDRRVGEYKTRRKIEHLDHERMMEVFGDMPFSFTNHSEFHYHDPQNPSSYRRRSDIIDKPRIPMPTLFLPVFGDTPEQIAEGKRKLAQEIIGKIVGGMLPGAEVSLQEDTEQFLNGDEVKYQVQIVVRANDLRYINGRANKLNQRLSSNHPTMLELQSRYGIDIQEVMSDFKEELPVGIDIARNGTVSKCYEIKLVIELKKTYNEFVTCLPMQSKTNPI